jgi:gliding motility-associated-like protein
MIYFYRLVLFSLTFFFVNHNVDAQSRCYNIDTNYIDFLNLGVLGNTITKGYTISNKLFYTEEFSQDDSVGYGSSVSDNYYFGGSIPSNVVSPNGGAAVSGIISNSTYSLIESDSCVEFSICADFFNTSLNASYNESAIWVGPANYKFFNPISRFENNNVSTYSTREGFFIVILHQSKKIYFINNRDDVTPTENAILIGSYLGDYVGVFFNMCIVLKYKRENLFIDVLLNGNVITSNNLIPNVLNYNYLNNFRFAICVDDKAKGFCINTTKTPKIISSTLPDTISANCTEFISVDAGNIGAGYLWSNGETTRVINTNIKGKIWLDIITECDSIRDSTFIKAITIPTYNNNQSICQGDKYMINGKTYTLAGIYRDTLKNMSANGCDSIVITNLSIKSVPTYNNNQSICQGNVYSINGKNYNTAGSYRDTLKNAASNGCDSIIITKLTLTSILQGNNPQTICFGKSYTINGHTYTSTGTYKDTIKNASVNGCDSIILTKLTITPILQGNKQDAFCEGNFYTLPSGKQVNMAGTYKDTIKNNAGCDSVVTIILKEKMNSSYKYAETICSNETYSFFGQQLNTSGKYTHQFIPSANGCDSTVELNLTVNPAPNIKVTANPTKVAFQQDIQLNIETTDNITNIIWRPAEVLNNPNLENPIAKINEPTWFVAEVSNNVDCKTSDSVLVSMKEVDCFFLPNTFTPNGNNRNDVFKPLGKFLKEIIIFRIFDRWGNMVFETNDPKMGWDGTFKGQLLEPDVFFYYIEGICIDGTKQFKKGDVTLIR